MAKRNEIDGDLVVPGSLVVLGGFQNSSYSRTVTRLAGAEENITTVTGEILDRPTYEEAAQQGFETRYTRANSAPSTPTGDNPAGWTLTVPTGSDAIWMSGAVRNFDGTISGTWYTPVRFTGAATVVGVLSNDRQTIPCDADGNNGNYTGAFTDMSVFEGAVDMTGLCTFGATPSTGITGTLVSNRYTVTLLTVDSGYVDIVADRTGMDQLTKRFSVSRTRIGDATPLYRMSVSSTVINHYPNGAIDPPSITFESSSNVGLSQPTPYAGIFKYYINDILQFISTSPQSSLLWDNSVLYPSDTLYPQDTLIPPVILSELVGDVTVMQCALWSADGIAMLDSQSVVFLKDVSFQMDDLIQDALDDVPNYTPKYLGKFLDSLPSSYRKGDWFLIYGIDDIPRQRGIYVVDGSLVAQRITGAASEDSIYIISAMVDILTVTNNAAPDYGNVSDYGSITFIANLVANTAFINSLMTTELTIGSGGKIKSANYSPGVSGFQLGSDGVLNASGVNISGAVNATSGTFSGTINAAGGTFSGAVNTGEVRQSGSGAMTIPLTGTIGTLFAWCFVSGSSGVSAVASAGYSYHGSFQSGKMYSGYTLTSTQGYAGLSVYYIDDVFAKTSYIQYTPPIYAAGSRSTYQVVI